jgi:hypothetical protein
MEGWGTVSQGNWLAWGKGSYGRLGHSESRELACLGQNEFTWGMGTGLPRAGQRRKADFAWGKERPRYRFLRKAGVQLCCLGQGDQ